MSSKRLLDNSAEIEADLPKKIKLEHKLILITISINMQKLISMTMKYKDFY